MVLIGEDRHVLRLPHQQVERRRAAGLVDRRLKHRQLSRSDGNQPDLFRLQHVSQRQRQPPRGRLRRILDRHRPQIVLHQRLVSREERTDVAVLADAKDGQVQRAVVQLRGQRVVVPQRRLAKVRFRRHPDRARRPCAERRQQHPLREAVVGVGIVRRHRPLVRPEQRDPPPVDGRRSSTRQGRSAPLRRRKARTTGPPCSSPRMTA